MSFDTVLIKNDANWSMMLTHELWIEEWSYFYSISALLYILPMYINAELVL